MHLLTRLTGVLWVLLGLLMQAHAGPLLINAQQPNEKTRPQYIRDHFDHINAWPAFDGMVVRTNAGWNLMNGAAQTYSAISSEFAPLVGLNFSRMKNNFAIVPVNRPADFFDSWAVTLENFRLFARVLRETGLVGVVLDTEEYMTPLWNYPDTCKYTSKTLDQYRVQANLVGQQVMQAMLSEFPGLQVIAYFGPCSSFSGAPPKAAGGNAGQWELMGPFEVGMIQVAQGAPNSPLFVDGGEVYNLRGPGDFQESYDYRKTTIALDSTNCPFIPASLRPVWPQNVSMSFGIYNLGYEPMDPSIMRTTLENALRRCDRLVWLYFENLDWNTPGGITQDWVNAVNGAKAAVSTLTQAPSVSVTNPLNNAWFVQPTSITLGASASDADGTVTKVEFFAGTTKLGEDLSAPYTCLWNTPSLGTYLVTAKATDNSGNTSVSAPVSLTVSNTFSAKVNFQPALFQAPSGYLADTGSVYASRNNGMTYGWNVPHEDEVRDRGGSTDPRLASLIQIHAGGFWEIAVPNGGYNVTLGIGDGGFPSTYTVNIEGINACTNQALAAGQFVSLTKTVLVSDGKLRIDQGTAGEEMTRVNYVLIDPVSSASPPTAPSSLSILSSTSSALELGWMDNSSNETGYRLERSSVSSFSPSTLLATLPADQVRYVDSGLAPATQYFYRVSAYNNAGASAWATASGTTAASAVPLPPMGVTAVPGNTQITVAWSPSSGATGYAVWRSTTAGGPYTVVQSGAGTSEVDSGLVNGTRYYYVVTASNGSGQSGYSAEVNAVPQATVAVPVAPTGLSVSPGDARVTLNWNLVSGAATYSVKRGTLSGGPYMVLGKTAAASWTDTGLVNGTPYFYVVSASNSSGEGPGSAEVSAKPVAPASVPAAPEALTAKAGDKKVTLSWNASPGATYYALKRSTTNGGPYTVLSGALTTLTFNDTAVVNGNTYYYVVTARNASGESTPSLQTGAVPRSPTAAPPAPTGLKTTVSGGKVVLSWNAVSGVSGYHVKRSLAAGGPFTVVGSAVPENRWVDSTATPGTAYFYLVTSLMESAASAQATATVVTPLAVSINFQPSASTVPAGYLGDAGELFGTRSGGLSYGWSSNHTDETRERGGTADPRLNTLIQIHAGGRWEIAVPNGSYSVTVGIGDGGFSSSHTLNVEGNGFWLNQALAAGQFVNQTRTVSVQDGRLTLDPGTAPEEATRINYVVIQGL